MKCLDRFVIPQESSWKNAFDIVMMLASCYNIFTNAFCTAFGEPTNTIGLVLD